MFSIFGQRNPYHQQFLPALLVELVWGENKHAKYRRKHVQELLGRSTEIAGSQILRNIRVYIEDVNTCPSGFERDCWPHFLTAIAVIKARH